MFIATAVITISACPALAVPCGFDQFGRPVGLQFVGKPRGEAEQILAEARKTRESMEQRMREETEAERQRRLEETRREIAAETARALEQIRAEVADLTLQAAGRVKRAKRRGAHRRRRARKAMVGMMLHQDASTHAWLPGDEHKYDLVVTMDDATSAIYSLFLVDQEGTASSLRGVREVVESHGLFCALYTDRGSHYFETPVAGERVSKTLLTQFGRALKQLGVEHLVSVSSAGSMREDIAPGDLLVASQFIDRTFARKKSFFETGLVAHVSMADPVCPRLGDAIEAVDIGGMMHGVEATFCREGASAMAAAVAEALRDDSTVESVVAASTSYLHPTSGREMIDAIGKGMELAERGGSFARELGRGVVGNWDSTHAAG